MRISPATEQLETVAKHLAPATGEFMFVGGCVLDLLITDPGAAPSRPTDDVDVVVQLLSPSDFYRMEDSLRSAGFVNDMASPVICSWIVNGIRVDIMPTSEAILGFSNRWYAQAFLHREPVVLPLGTTAHHISAPYFLATKTECFHNPERENNNDFWSSRDLGDIVAVVDGRPELVDECNRCDLTLMVFLREQFQKWLYDDQFEESIGAHLLPDTASQLRKPIILNRFNEIVKLGSGGHVSA